MNYTKDPEPWVHRWPNSRNEYIRSENEQCTMKDCKATYEPRSLEQLNAPRRWSRPWWGNLLGRLRGDDGR